MNTQDENSIRVEQPFVTALQHWLSGALGGSVMITERHRASMILPDLFGYHLLQLGLCADKCLLESSRIHHRILTAETEQPTAGNIPGLVCKTTALPVATESMDVVVLPHVLEFATHPHQILRETERVLIGEGHLIIMGFNPWSLFGLWRLFLAWRDRPPWCGHYIGLPRLRDWLTLLDFEIIKTECFYFRPPLENTSVMQRLNFMEQLGRYCWPWWGGIYLLVAKKRVFSMTPIKLQWQTRRRMITAGLVEPSARLTSTRNDG